MERRRVCENEIGAQELRGIGAQRQGSSGVSDMVLNRTGTQNTENRTRKWKEFYS